MLATKVHGPMGDDPNQQGNSRRWIMQAVEASLRRLQTDHIDLYQIHRPAPDTDIEETLSALTDLMRAGKVRAIGSSTFPASEIVEAQWVADRRGLARFRTEQPPYSILNRSVEREVLPVCQTYGMGALVWSPLAKGMLTGRYRKGQPLPESLRVKAFPQQMADDRNLDAVERLIPIAEAAGLSLTHMAMAFVMAHPGVTSAILGPRTMPHLDDLLAGAERCPQRRYSRQDRRDCPARRRRRPDGRALCATGLDPGKLASSPDGRAQSGVGGWVNWPCARRRSPSPRAWR